MPVPLHCSRLRPATCRPSSKGVGLAFHLRTGNLSVVAAAGLDLFRKGLLLDGVVARQQFARRPAERPSLSRVPEDESDGEPTESRAIVVMGDDSESWAMVERHTEKAAELFWEAQRARAEQQADAGCYLIPMSESASEAVQIRDALAKAGVSPHLVVTDCCSMNLANGLVQLVQTLRQLHIQAVHVVTLTAQLPRIRLVVDRVLVAASTSNADSMRFSATYHCSVDGLPTVEPSRSIESERETLRAAEVAARSAIDALKRQRSRSLVIPKRTRLSVHTRES